MLAGRKCGRVEDGWTEATMADVNTLVDRSGHSFFALCSCTCLASLCTEVNLADHSMHRDIGSLGVCFLSVSCALHQLLIWI